MGLVHQSGFVAPGALLLAAVSALGLVAGCHSASLSPAAAHGAAPTAAVASQAPADFATVHPFEEMFHVMSPEDAEPQN